MSDYYRSLDVSVGARYVAKLQLLGLDEGGDPYATHNAEKFTDDMSLWPALEYGHIFCYFIDRPGVYTKQQLLQWKKPGGLQLLHEWPRADCASVGSECY